MAGKRETYTHRPMAVSDEQLASNWERIFGLPKVHGDAPQAGPKNGAGSVQETDTPTTGPRA